MNDDFLARFGAPDSPLDLPTGVVLEVDWPDRTAAVVSDALHEPLIAALRRHGVVPIRVSVADVGDVVDTIEPFTLLFVDAGGIDTAGGHDVVRRLWARSPHARGILLTDGVTDSTTVIAALRAGITEVVDGQGEESLESVVSTQLRLALAGRERVLAIGAHPDDVEIGCAATLLRHRRQGDQVSILTLSQGAVGGVRELRRQEAISTALSMGSQLLLGSLDDTRVDGGIDTIRSIEQVIRAVRPTRVYVHSLNDSHQDHRAVHTAVLSASRQVPAVFAYQSPSTTYEFRPSKFVPVDETIVAKVGLLALFTSQADRAYLEPEMVMATARYWARQLAPLARFAEPFEVIRSMDTGAPAADREQFALVPSPILEAV